MRLATCCVAACVLYPALGLAQSIPASATAGIASPIFPSPLVQDVVIEPARPPLAATTRTATDAGFFALFRLLPGDFGRFFSVRTTKIVGFGGAAALTTHGWDDEGIGTSQEHLRSSLFNAGNVGGGFLMQVGASASIYSIARLTGDPALAAAGSDLLRGHVLSQGLVQAGKVATRRTRPDASNNRSLPSGHTAAAFTTATVVHHHFGWEAGIPAYTFGAYVAASRMAANKHHLSDVVLGAAIGIAASRTITVGFDDARVDVGVTPTPGGAAIAFTIR